MASILDTVAILVTKRRASIGSQENSSSSVVLDASVSETHNSSADITSHPVEIGANITDHVHRQPDSITIQGIISNTSTVFPTALPGAPVVRSIANLVNGVTNDLAKTAYETLKDLVEGRELVKIVTTLREYTDMLIEDLTVTRDANYGDALNFTMRARQVRLVKTSITDKDKVPAPKEAKQKSKKSLGKKPTSTPPAASTPASTPLRNLTSLF